MNAWNLSNQRYLLEQSGERWDTSENVGLITREWEVVPFDVLILVLRRRARLLNVIDFGEYAKRNVRRDKRGRDDGVTFRRWFRRTVAIADGLRLVCTDWSRVGQWDWGVNFSVRRVKRDFFDCFPRTNLPSTILIAVVQSSEQDNRENDRWNTAGENKRDVHLFTHQSEARFHYSSPVSIRWWMESVDAAEKIVSLTLTIDCLCSSFDKMIS